MLVFLPNCVSTNLKLLLDFQMKIQLRGTQTFMSGKAHNALKYVHALPEEEQTPFIARLDRVRQLGRPIG
jgi:hypothetical protein